MVNLREEKLDNLDWLKRDSYAYTYQNNSSPTPSVVLSLKAAVIIKLYSN